MIDGTLVRFAAAGAYLAVIPSGAWIARYVIRGIASASARERFTAAITLGVGAWSLLYATLAIANRFSPLVNGVLGWIVVAIATWRLLRERRLSERLRELRPRLRLLTMTIVALAALGGLYIGFPHESLLGIRDEAIYTVTALALERTGSLEIFAPETVITIARELFSPLIDGEAFYVPGVYAIHGKLILQFSPLPPAWIAQAHAACGDIALYRASGGFALASVVLFHGIVRRLLLRPVAFACTVAFALNPAQIWIARINLAESLGQLLVLAALWLSLRALDAKSRRIAVTAGLLFGLAAFVRLDAVLLAPLLFAAAFAIDIWSRQRSAYVQRTALTLALSAAAGQMVAVAAFAIASPPYVASNQNVLWTAVLAVMACFLALVACRSRCREFLVTRSTTTVLEWICAIALVALFAYAAWLRPDHEPFATINRPNHPWDGQRDWREQSLVNLAAYLGWPLLLLALAGSVFAATRMLRRRLKAESLLIWIIAVPTAVVVLANPRVSPDHFWAIRRFVAIVIPGAIILAGFGFETLLVRYGRRNISKCAWAIAVVIGAALLFEQRSTLFVRENRGITAQLRDVAALTGHAPLVIVRDLDPLATTLLVGFGQPVVPWRDASSGVDAKWRALWSQCNTAAPCILLHRSFTGLSGLALGETKTLILTRNYIAPTFSPLPNARAHEVTRILMTPVTGFLQPFDTGLSGGYRDRETR